MTQIKYCYLTKLYEFLILKYKRKRKPKRLSEYILFIQQNKNPLGKQIILQQFTKQEVTNLNQDCWIIVEKKIYDITKYLDYHPGGVDILVESFGKDATQLFCILIKFLEKYHPNVNIKAYLGQFQIGFIE